MHQVLKIRQFSRLQKSLIRKRGLMQRWVKGLMILRRYQLKLQMTSVKIEKNSRARKANRRKEKEGSSDALISKDKKILAAEQKLKWKNPAYSDLAKRLEDNEALSTREMKKLSEKQKIIQEQAK